MTSNITYMSGVKSLNEIDVSGQGVLICVDFNVSMDEHLDMSDDSQTWALPTINYCIDHKVCSIAPVTHLGRFKDECDERFSLMFTGGGASLELLQGKVLTGFERLERMEN